MLVNWLKLQYWKLTKNLTEIEFDREKLNRKTDEMFLWIWAQDKHFFFSDEKEFFFQSYKI